MLVSYGDEKMRRIVFVTIICAFMSATASAALWNTGVTGGGASLANGVLDTHYTLTLPDTTVVKPEAIVPGHPNWVVPPAAPAAEWIGPTGFGTHDPVGVYVYTAVDTFSTSAADIATGVVLSGNWASDNAGAIYLNGSPATGTGVTTGTGDFGSLTAFSITGGFNPGTNTLGFQVTNDENPTALLVSDLDLTVVPVPGAVLLGMLGLSVAGLKLRKFA